MKEFITKFGVLIVAVIALVQHWLLYIWRKFFRKGKIDIFPSGTIAVGYSLFGPTIGLNGTLRCVNQDLFVQSMTLGVIKQKDRSEHFLDWGVFGSQKLTHRGEEAEIELPYGFMLNITQPKRYNIVFFDTNTKNEMQELTRKVQEEWGKTISSQIRAGILPKEELISKIYYDEFSKSGINIETYTKLDRLCYWEPGEYSMALRVYTSKPNQVFEKKWKFRLNEEGVRSIRLNVVKMLQDVCMVPSYGQYNFAYSKYE